MSLLDEKKKEKEWIQVSKKVYEQSSLLPRVSQQRDKEMSTSSGMSFFADTIRSAYFRTHWLRIKFSRHETSAVSNS